MTHSVFEGSDVEKIYTSNPLSFLSLMIHPKKALHCLNEKNMKCAPAPGTPHNPQGSWIKET